MVIYLTLIYSDLSFKLIDSNGSMMAHLRCDSYDSKSSRENFFHQLPGLELLKHSPENYVGCEMKLTIYLLKMSLSEIKAGVRDVLRTSNIFRKAIYIIVLNQMSPRQISGILYEYLQFTT